MEDGGRTTEGATRREVRPTYTVPLPIIGLIVFLATLLGATFAILPFVIDDTSLLLRIGSGAGVMLVLLSWAGLFRAWTTRRRFSRCVLVLQGGSVSPGTVCRFAVANGENVLTDASFSLSYQDVFRRAGGRKIYTHGPFVLDVEVKSEPGSDAGRPRMIGEFVVGADQIKIDPPDENWDSHTLVLLALRLPGGRSCRFELPFDPRPVQASVA